MARDGTLRLFVAAYPPPASRREMAGALAALCLAELRATPAEMIHLTLLFMGDVPAASVEDVVESVERSGSGIGPVMLTPRRIVALPERGDPRLVALTTDGPSGLVELQRRLAQRLAAPHGRERGRFLPHFTLGRFRHGVRAPRVDLSAAIAPFTIDRVVLVRSVLGPGGAEHGEIAGADLIAGAAPAQ